MFVSNNIRQLYCLIAVMIFAIAVNGCSNNKRIPRSQAKTIADGYLDAFCAREGLNSRMFSTPSILGPKLLNGEKWWLFQYQYGKLKNAKINVCVSEYGLCDICGIGPGIPERQHHP